MKENEKKSPAKKRSVIDSTLKLFLLGGSQLLAGVGGVLLFLLILVTFVSVVGRRSPVAGAWLTGGYEITELLMALLSVLATAWCWYQSGHIRIGLFRDNRSPRVRAILDAISSFLGMILLIAVTWSVFQISGDSLAFGVATTYFRIPEGPFQIIFGLIAAHFAIVLGRSFFGYLMKALGRQTEPWAIMKEKE
jgi:TRAP-type C4-dicarboxylate transport system permease small subunit